MGLMDSLFSSEQKSTSTNQAYAPAQPGIDNALSFMQNLPWAQAYQDPYAASMNPYMQQGIGGAARFGYDDRMGGQFANQMFKQGQTLMGAGAEGYQKALSGISSGAATPRWNLDMNARQQAMDSYMPGLESLVRNNGIMNSQQTQSQLGQLTSAAGQTNGSLGSNPLSKLGQGGAALNAANTMNSRNFAANLYNTANQAGLNAAMRGADMGFDADSNRYSQMLRGNQNLMGMGNRMMSQGYGAGRDNINMLNQAGNMQQRFDQFNTDMNRQQFMDNQMIPRQDAAMRGNFAANIGNMFGTQTTRNEQTPSTFNQIGALGQMAMGLGSGFGSMGSGGGMGGWNPFSATPSQGGMMTPTYGASGRSWNWDSVYGG